MFKSKEPPIVISIGGSLIVPNGGPNTTFLTNLNQFIRQQVKKGRRFFLVAGGGATARHYIEGGKKVIGTMTDEDLDWLGIHTTRLNGHLLRTIFMDIANPRIIENYDNKLNNWREPVVIGAGWKPGWSTDYCAVVLARDYNASMIINLSNIDWVYDKDPNKFPDAKPLKNVTWRRMEDFVGHKWVPGKHAPLDPIAVQLAKKLQINAVIANGLDFKNLEKIIQGESFKGTLIMPFSITPKFYDKNYYQGKKGGHKLSYFESKRGRIIHNLANLYRAILIKVFLNPTNCLDAGCGTGYLVKWLRRLKIDAYGVEVSGAALELASKEVRPYLRQADIRRLPFEPNQFDLVLSFDVLEHIERDNILKAIAETIRVSRRYILHKVYTPENVWINLTHDRDFSRLSIHNQGYWKKLFESFANLAKLQKKFPTLPAFFETVFFLEKKT